MNLADFFTKTLPTKQHEATMPRLVQTTIKNHALHTSGNWHYVAYRRGHLRP
jgi:hypothetical protein